MKKRIVFKRYVIHILAVPAITSEAFDLPPNQNALIVCSDITTPFIDGDVITNKLIIPFLDVEIKDIPGGFTGAHARMIIRFLQKLPESVSDLYICCSKGGSRSPALAAAILKASGRSDDAVWKNPFYVPNKLVYKKMCEELGFFMPWTLVRYKAFINAAQYSKSKKRGNTGKYDRWQIIF